MPTFVKPVVKLRSDLEAISNLLEGPNPKCVRVRLDKIGWVGYGLGDASGDDYRAGIIIKGKLHFRYGQ